MAKGEQARRGIDRSFFPSLPFPRVDCHRFEIVLKFPLCPVDIACASYFHGVNENGIFSLSHFIVWLFLLVDRLH